MNKIEYLIRTLSRTKRKDYENYVINRVWNLLDDLEIKPVTQQYVKRKDGKYALIDLYFPQFNVGIECDEVHHLTQSEADKLRFDDIAFAIDDYKEKRVKIFKKKGDKPDFYSIDEINKQIDDIVSYLKSCKKQAGKNFIPWTEEADYKKAIQQKFISVKDNFFFRTNSEIREFFGRHSNFQKSFYIIDGKTGDHLWLPHLAIETSNEYKAATNAGHINLLSNDGEKIYEWVNDSGEEFTGENFRRITFAKSKNNLGQSGFKFIGVFEFSGFKEIEIKKGDKRKFRVHKRVVEEIRKI